MTFLAAISMDNILRFFKGLWKGLMDPFMFADRFGICNSAFQLMFVKQSLLIFIFCFAVVIPSITKQIVTPSPQSSVYAVPQPIRTTTQFQAHCSSKSVAQLRQLSKLVSEPPTLGSLLEARCASDLTILQILMA